MDNGGVGRFWTLSFGVGIAMSILAPALVLAETFLRADVPTRGESVALTVLFLAAVRVLLAPLATVATLIAGSQQALLARARTNA